MIAKNSKLLLFFGGQICILGLLSLQISLSCKSTPWLKTPSFDYELVYPASGHVGIIVALKGRAEHKEIFTHYMVDYLTNQGQSFTILYVNQDDKLPFNRGSLFNAGYDIMKTRPEIPTPTHVFLHDVDLLPLSGVPYGMPPGDPKKQFYQMSSSMSHFEWDVAYVKNCGGVNMATAESFELTNGFNNHFWGWGGEDDHLRLRAYMAGVLR